MPRTQKRRTWVLALVFGSAAMMGSIGAQVATGHGGHAQAGYLNPPPPPLRAVL